MSQQLPIMAHEDTILAAIENNPVVIIVGATGSGKTTQVPRFLLEAGFADAGRIGVTQPRRIAATSIAGYVAGQIGCALGGKVGYHVRFDNSTSDTTDLSFITDGILLRQLKDHSQFEGYSVVVFDEAQERNEDLDLELGLAKRALLERPDLKIVVMSATIDADTFSRYFDNAPIINVEGRMYPVEVRYAQENDKEVAIRQFKARPQHGIEAHAASVVDRIHRLESPGDILVFMPGKEEIDRTIAFIQSLGHSDLFPIPVHGQLSLAEQKRIFEKVPGRKVAVATNVAEGGITVDGIVYIVDSALIKQMSFNPNTGISSLQTIEHSLDGLIQRRGRGGRTQPGICYCLFTQEEEENGRVEYLPWYCEKREHHTRPEIQRSDLAGVVLRMIGMGIPDIENFDFISPPSRLAIHNAFQTLRAIGAIDKDGKITKIGEQLLHLPLEPRIGRMVLAAQEYGCTDEICAIAATLSTKIFVRPKDKEVEADRAHIQFIDRRSDFLSNIKALLAFADQPIGIERSWAETNFLSSRSLSEALKVKDQLIQILQGLDIPITSVLDNWRSIPDDAATRIGKAVTAGLIHNLAVDIGRHQYQRDGDILFIHPGSVLFSASPKLMICAQVVTTTKSFGRCCQRVEVEWVQEIAPHRVKVEETPRVSSIYGGLPSILRTIYIDDIFVKEEYVNSSTIEQKVDDVYQEAEELYEELAQMRQDLTAFGFNQGESGRTQVDALVRQLDGVLHYLELKDYSNARARLAQLRTIIQEKKTFTAA